jgi:hypothetical protein
METLNYWNENGKFQKELDKLYKELVPSTGRAKSLRGEVLRAANELYYERFNNGNINAVEEIEDNEDIDGMTRLKITPFFKNFIAIIRYVLGGEGLRAVGRVEESLIDTDENHLKIFDKDYETMMDSIIIWVDNEKKDEEIPNWYEN